MSKKKNSQDDFIFESDLENTGGEFNKKIQKIKDQLKKCQEEKNEYLNGWQRSKADFVNLKKRNEDDLKKIKDYANEDLILSLIPTIDNFEAALKDHGESDEIKKWKTGFEHIYTHFKKILENLGVDELNPLDDNFDPNKHEAIEELETKSKENDQKIAEVVMKGYTLKGRILRAPQVKVWVFK